MDFGSIDSTLGSTFGWLATSRIELEDGIVSRICVSYLPFECTNTPYDPMSEALLRAVGREPTRWLHWDVVIALLDRSHGNRPRAYFRETIWAIAFNIAVDIEILQCTYGTVFVAASCWCFVNAWSKSSGDSCTWYHCVINKVEIGACRTAYLCIEVAFEKIGSPLHQRAFHMCM